MAAGRNGVLDDPRLLAAGAAGLAATVAVLWVSRGLPGGTVLFWTASLPLFVAGIGFGTGSCVLASILAAALAAVSAGSVPSTMFLALFGVPAPLLVAAARTRGPGTALALTGLWPLALLLATSWWLAEEGGLAAVLRRLVGLALESFGVPALEGYLTLLPRLMPAMLGGWMAAALIACAAAARRLLARHGLGAPVGDWRTVRLPGWYPLVPAVTAGLALAAPTEGDTVLVSALLLTLLPLFFQGLAGVHRRLAGRPFKTGMLAGLYALLLPAPHLMGPALVVLGLHDQLIRRNAPNNT